MKKQNKTIKQLITKWLGIDTKIEMMQMQMDTLEQRTTDQIVDFEYKLEDKADCYQMDNLESELSDCPQEWRVEEMIESRIDDLDFPTREGIQEIVIEENHEMVLEMVKNTVSEIEQKEFDYDLVVSQVVAIIVEKLNK